MVKTTKDPPIKAAPTKAKASSSNFRSGAVLNYGGCVSLRIHGTPSPKIKTHVGGTGTENSGQITVSDDGEAKFQKAFIRSVSQTNKPYVLGRESLRVELQLIFYFPRPESHFIEDKQGNLVLAPSAPTGCINHLSLHSLVDFVVDALKGVAYKETCQVMKLQAFKRYINYKPGTLYQAVKDHDGYTRIHINDGPIYEHSNDEY